MSVYYGFMKLERGSLFLGFAGLVGIVLIVALAAAVADGKVQSSLSPDDSGGDISLGATGNKPEPAQPVVKTANYPGIPTSYEASLSHLRSYSFGSNLYISSLTLNDDGTITVKGSGRADGSGFGQYSFTCTGGQWYKIKGKGHTIYIDGTDLAGTVYGYTKYLDLQWTDNIATISDQSGIYNAMSLPAQNGYGDSILGKERYTDWDAGYATMSASADLLAPYIDSCVPAGTARPYVEKGYTGQQAVPYIAGNVPAETALLYLNASITYDVAKPYIAADIPVDMAIDLIKKKGSSPTK
jgi:hypothetical protein